MAWGVGPDITVTGFEIFEKKTPKKTKKQNNASLPQALCLKKSLMQIKSKPVYISLFSHKYLKLDILQSIYNMWTGSYKAKQSGYNT